MPRRVTAFAVLAAVCLAGAAVTVLVAVSGHGDDRGRAARAAAGARPAAVRTLAAGRAYAVFLNRDDRRGNVLGSLLVAPLRGGRPAGRIPAGPVCWRASFAGGRGVCLALNGATGTTAIVLDDRLRELRRIDLPGIPTRVRVSPDGRWAGVTGFVAGHAYTSPGQFSTETTIVDLRTGRTMGNFERALRVTVDGRPFAAAARNYWGVTFAPDRDTFYATAQDGARTWLIQGSIRTRRARAIHANVECPSVSPDGTRIAYKKAVARNPTAWRFTVLDLATGRETPLAETRSIDDQLAWLDDDHVLYADTGHTTWVVPADGSGRPRRWLERGDSATVTPAGTSAGGRGA